MRQGEGGGGGRAGRGGVGAKRFELRLCATLLPITARLLKELKNNFVSYPFPIFSKKLSASAFNFKKGSMNLVWKRHGGSEKGRKQLGKLKHQNEEYGLHLPKQHIATAERGVV